MKLRITILDGIPHRLTVPDFWISILGRRGAPPKGAPKNELHQITLSLVSIDSSRCPQNISNVCFDDRLPWGPREPKKGAPKGAPIIKVMKIHQVWYQSLRLDAHDTYWTFVLMIDPIGPQGAPTGRLKKWPRFSQVMKISEWQLAAKYCNRFKGMST